MYICVLKISKHRKNIKMVDALQFTEEHGEACPANWNKEKAGLKATHEGVADYLSKN